MSVWLLIIADNVIHMLINVGAVLAGTLIGVAVGSRLPERFQKRVLAGLGLVTLVIGVDLVRVVVLGLLVCCRASARVYRSRLRLSWFDDIPRELIALAVPKSL